MVYWFERGVFLVLTGMPRPVLGESYTTSIKDFAIFPPHQKKKKKKKSTFLVGKKHLNCFNYDSAVYFQFEGIEANTKILFFSVKN